MTRTVLMLLVAFATGTAAVGCGPSHAGQSQAPANPLPPIQGKATQVASSGGDAGPMKPLPPR